MPEDCPEPQFDRVVGAVDFNLARLINALLIGQNFSTVVSTTVYLLAIGVQKLGLADGNKEAMAYLAAALISPADAEPGSLLPEMHAELAKLRESPVRPQSGP
jgi:hypothetical protein